jgi:hypothetical protein
VVGFLEEERGFESLPLLKILMVRTFDQEIDLFGSGCPQCFIHHFDLKTWAQGVQVRPYI